MVLHPEAQVQAHSEIVISIETSYQIHPLVTFVQTPIQNPLHQWLLEDQILVAVRIMMMQRKNPNASDVANTAIGDRIVPNECIPEIVLSPKVDHQEIVVEEDPVQR